MIIWQDWVIAIGQGSFLVANYFAIRSPHKPALIHSGLTFPWLLAFGICFATLGLWGSAITSTLGGLCWLTLYWQRVQQIRDEDRIRRAMVANPYFAGSAPDYNAWDSHIG